MTFYIDAPVLILFLVVDECPSTNVFARYISELPIDKETKLFQFGTLDNLTINYLNWELYFTAPLRQYSAFLRH